MSNVPGLLQFCNTGNESDQQRVFAQRGDQGAGLQVIT